MKPLRLKVIDLQIEDYYKNHGKYPSKLGSKEWARIDSWLRRNHKVTLAKHIKASYGFASQNRDRSFEKLDKEILEYRQKYSGEFPSTKSSAEWNAWDSWIRRNGKHSLGVYAREMVKRKSLLMDELKFRVILDKCSCCCESSV